MSNLGHHKILTILWFRFSFYDLKYSIVPPSGYICNCSVSLTVYISTTSSSSQASLFIMLLCVSFPSRMLRTALCTKPRLTRACLPAALAPRRWLPWQPNTTCSWSSISFISSSSRRRWQWHRWGHSSDRDLPSHGALSLDTVYQATVIKAVLYSRLAQISQYTHCHVM